VVSAGFDSAAFKSAASVAGGSCAIGVVSSWASVGVAAAHVSQQTAISNRLHLDRSAEFSRMLFAASWVMVWAVRDNWRHMTSKTKSRPEPTRGTAQEKVLNSSYCSLKASLKKALKCSWHTGHPLGGAVIEVVFGQPFHASKTLATAPFRGYPASLLRSAEGL
jgi:hypothetical protein